MAGKRRAAKAASTRRRAAAALALFAAGTTAAFTPRAVVSAAFNTTPANTGNAFAAGSLHVPTGLTVTPACAGSTPSVNASWTAAAGGSTPTGYRLQRQLAAVTQNTIQTAATNTVDTGMANGQTYSYRVFSYLSGWTSPTTSQSVLVNCATNLLTNPDFETGGNASPWRLDTNGNFAAIAATPVHGGAASMLVPVSTQAYTSLSVTAATAYTFTVWAYTAAGASTARLRAVSGASPYGTEIANIQGTGTPGTWGQVTLNFNSGAATTVTLLVSTAGAQTDVYADDVSLS